MTATARFTRRLAGTTAIAASIMLTGGTAQAADIPAVTDQYLYSTSLSSFSQIRGDRPYAAQLDWSSDACSWSPDRPLGYDFTRACHRHDFGYRNYKRQNRFSESARKRIDDNFYTDMKTICAGRWACNSAAWTYYKAVRQFGAS